MDMENNSDVFWNLANEIVNMWFEKKVLVNDDFKKFTIVNAR